MHELIKYVFIISSHIWKFDHFKDLTQLLLPMPSMLGKKKHIDVITWISSCRKKCLYHRISCLEKLEKRKTIIVVRVATLPDCRTHQNQRLILLRYGDSIPPRDIHRIHGVL